ncbi:T3SS effector HopA1 family protein [Emticicia fluvialis]|uniref:T3SS effector HopA1 family protein n=1 Tax=Emticicia fluvialis TaxID=2974474 RepID=UPI002165C402|nr:T3SS effector HopA1 family protein [Emticicia fluvialis]
MTLTTRKQIDSILVNVDSAFQPQMLLARKEEELIGKKYAISDQIYCLYANVTEQEKLNEDNKESFNWLAKQFYQSDEQLNTWDKNWTLDEQSVRHAKRHGKFYLCKGEQYKLVSAGDFVSSSSFPNQDKIVDLRIKRLEILDNAWFYFRGIKYLGSSFITRIYFHFNYDFETIARFSKDLQDELNNWLIPFEYKFAIRKNSRLDNAVLYTAREHYLIVFYIVKKIATAPQYADLFGSATLPFTKKTVLRGITFGEEPPIKNSSFGKYRADILAEIYIEYYQTRTANISKQRLSGFVKKRLLEMGFNLDDFFRNPQSKYPYDFSILSKAFNGSKRYNPLSENNYLNWALHIGRLICRQALVINQKGKTHCYWLSLIEDETSSFEYRLTDDSFNEGRLGIIYFLAKLYSYFPNEYLFRFLCKTVLKDISATMPGVSDNYQFIEEINKCLDFKLPKRLKKKQIHNHLLVNEIVNTLNETDSYTKIDNDGPQPIIKMGYSAIGLILLAIAEGNLTDLIKLEGFYAKDTLLKIINQVKF